MSRFLKMALSWNGAPVPFKFIANDGNFVAPDGVFFTTPEILPEGDPRPPQSVTGTGGTGGSG